MGDAQNIVLSGGSTMFKNFGKRLNQDIKDLVKERIDNNLARIGTASSVRGSRARDPVAGRDVVRVQAGVVRPDLPVRVISHMYQRYAVWFGGAMLAATVRLLPPCYLVSC